MYVYKLKYKTKKEALDDLLLKQVYIIEEGNYLLSHNIVSIVELGLIISTQAIYNDEGVQITAPTYLEGYHYDVMTEIEIDFGVNAITPTNPKHNFAGYEVAN